MGRSIASPSHRVDSKIEDWRTFSKHMPQAEKQAFEQLAQTVRNRRQAIEEASEADFAQRIFIAILITHEAKLNAINKCLDSLSTGKNRL